jgi:hypothetical protein
MHDQQVNPDGFLPPPCGMMWLPADQGCAHMTEPRPFTGQRSPCGRSTTGQRVFDDDEQGYVFEHLTWDCGCQTIRRQFHDGSVQHQVLDHHGKIRSDEHSGLHEG